MWLRAWSVANSFHFTAANFAQRTLLCVVLVRCAMSAWQWIPDCQCKGCSGCYTYPTYPPGHCWGTLAKGVCRQLQDPLTKHRVRCPDCFPALQQADQAMQTAAAAHAAHAPGRPPARQRQGWRTGSMAPAGRAVEGAPGLSLQAASAQASPAEAQALEAAAIEDIAASPQASSAEVADVAYAADSAASAQASAAEAAACARETFQSVQDLEAHIHELTQQVTGAVGMLTMLTRQVELLQAKLGSCDAPAPAVGPACPAASTVDEAADDQAQSSHHYKHSPDDH